MKDIDPDKIIYTRPYIPKWMKVTYFLMLAPIVLIVGGFLLMLLAVAVAAL
jgi:hypothetical protein